MPITGRLISLTPNGNVRYQLKTPYRDGTTHVIFEPLDFIARLAALVPKPRVNLTRFHGVFAPNSKQRARVTPARRGVKAVRVRRQRIWMNRQRPNAAAMTWVQRLKRVFGIDIETCPACGGAMRIIACIEDPVVIEKILAHLDAKASEPEAPLRSPCRGRRGRPTADARVARGRSGETAPCEPTKRWFILLVYTAYTRAHHNYCSFLPIAGQTLHQQRPR